MEQLNFSKQYVFIYNEQESWYFTSKWKAAKYMGATPSNVNVSLKNGYKCKGWTVKLVEAQPIDQYIDPEPKKGQLEVARDLMHQAINIVNQYIEFKLDA